MLSELSICTAVLCFLLSISERKSFNCFRVLEILVKLSSFRLKEANENQDDLEFGRILKSICHKHVF